MDPETHRLIAALHGAPYKCVLAVTGGGARAAGLLLSVPGGSRTVLEVQVPYSEQALTEYLGRRPEQFCSAATSLALAARAYERACRLAPGEPAVGLGCTATLATDRPKRGDHRFHLSTHTETGPTTYSVVLKKGARDREAEEAVLDAVLLNALADAFAIALRLKLPLLPGEEVQVEPGPANGLLAVLRDEVAAVCIQLDGRLAADALRPAALLPGAFNPVHEGHWRLAQVAGELLGVPVAFELSVRNVDKGQLPVREIRRRLAPFAWRAAVWVTPAATFAEKASLFPGVVFIVGADTAERLVAPRYYQASETRLAEALEHIRKQGCRFLVAGRDDRQGNFVGLENLTLPPGCRDLFTAIPRSAFHVPLSSTDLREQEKTRLVAPPPEAE